MNKRKLYSVLGLAFFIFGLLAFTQAFYQTVIVFDLGLKNGIYGTEQVAVNACFIRAPDWTPDYPDCYLVNYDQLMEISVGVSFLGFVVWRYFAGYSQDARTSDGKPAGVSKAPA